MLLGAVLVTAFFLEGRWALPVYAANLLGVAIAVGAGLWVAYRLLILKSADDPLLVAPWPAAFLPYLGPLMMVLMVAKLIRPKQHSDYWVLQVVALLQIALACAMANDPADSDLIFGLLLFGYVASGLWWLLLCYLHREQTTAAQLSSSRVPWRMLGIVQTFSWLLVGGTVGLVLFLLTPRVSSLQQPLVLPGAPSGGTTGYADTIDLNVTGQVQVNDEVALRVIASYDMIGPKEKPRLPKTDLNPEQRWRGATLSYYDKERGRWYRRFPSSLLSRTILGQPFQPRSTVPELRARFGGLMSLGPGQVVSWVNIDKVAPTYDFGPQRFFLNYTLNPKRTRGVFLAEPVILSLSRNVVTLGGEGRDEGNHWGWLQDNVDGSPMPIVQPSGTVYYYRQLTRPPVEWGVSPAERLSKAYVDQLRIQQPVERINSWTTNLLRILAKTHRYNLAEEDLEADADGLLPKNWEKVARALATYLAHSGDFTYTLDLRRKDLSLDPVEDFLFNLRQGHCERYATALTLMLRTQRVPARVVLGFRGGSNEGEGTYLVRQSHAHSWVETLIQRPGRGNSPPEYYWLALDPTPPDRGEDSEVRALRDWWTEGWRRLQTVWRDFVVGYGFEEQNTLGTALSDRATKDQLPRFKAWAAGALSPRELWLSGAALGAIGAAFCLGFWLRRRRLGLEALPARSPTPTVAFYARLLALLSRHLGLRPHPSETAHEFAEAAERALQGALANRVVAVVPSRIAQLFYRVRYGGQEASDTESHEVTCLLDDLEALLKARPMKEGLPGLGQQGA
jgi:hypothetical protein